MTKKSARGSWDHPSFVKQYHPTRHNGRKQALNKLNFTDVVKERHDTESGGDANASECKTVIADKSAGPERFVLSEFVINKQQTKEIKQKAPADSTTDDWVMLALRTQEKCTSRLDPTYLRQGHETLNDKVDHPTTSSHSLASALNFEWVDNRPNDFEDFEMIYS